MTTPTGPEAICYDSMVSRFTHPTDKFATPYRIHGWHVCNSCGIDPELRLDRVDFQWRPRHAGTPPQFECTRLIAPEKVSRVIDRVPGISSAPAQARPLQPDPADVAFRARRPEDSFA